MFKEIISRTETMCQRQSESKPFPARYGKWASTPHLWWLASSLFRHIGRQIPDRGTCEAHPKRTIETRTVSKNPTSLVWGYQDAAISDLCSCSPTSRSWLFSGIDAFVPSCEQTHAQPDATNRDISPAGNLCPPRWTAASALPSKHDPETLIPRLPFCSPIGHAPMLASRC